MIETVPQKCHRKNLRTLYHPNVWKAIKQYIYLRSGRSCEICGKRGRKWPVECHEVWKPEGHVLKLVDVIALCPPCHRAKHYLRTRRTNNKYAAQAYMRLKRLNGWSDAKLQRHIDDAKQTYAQLKEVRFVLDMSFAADEIWVFDAPIHMREVLSYEESSRRLDSFLLGIYREH